MGQRIVLVAWMVVLVLVLASAPALAVPEVPKIDSMVMSATQPADTSSDTIWYDNFDVDRIASYFEPEPGSSDLRYSTTAFGHSGKSMECHYPAGRDGFGNGLRHLAFGDCPLTTNRRRSGEKFDDVYWRIYVKYPKDWVGGTGVKLSRGNEFANANWAQAGILHCWGGRGVTLTLDPATGVKDNLLISTTWNDFRRLTWLGNRPSSTFRLADTTEVGRWVSVECRMKLNSTTPTTDSSGATVWDGYSAMWIDGKLDSERTNMNYRGTWDERGINAVFLETYWNAGSPVSQSRQIDDFVISTKPIGPVTVPGNPTMFKTPWTTTECTGWEVVIASDSMGANVVWSSNTLPGASDQVVVNTGTGTFSGEATGRDSLPSGPMYFSRVRQQDSTGWSDWSYWHQPFMVAPASGATATKPAASSSPAK